MPVYQLSEELIAFPNPSLAEDDGLLAIGGDLSVERLILAYQNGIFPWYSEGDPILWFAPDPRFVLYPDKLRLSKSMKSLIKKDIYTLTANKAFEEVIEACKLQSRLGQEGTWITEDMTKAYKKLHQLNYAESVEVWNDKNELVGGLYGVVLGSVFFGESMFHKESNTSKLAFISLVQSGRFKIIDCQVHTAHLESLGAEYIPLTTFQEILRKECYSI